MPFAMRGLLKQLNLLILKGNIENLGALAGLAGRWLEYENLSGLWETKYDQIQC
jgi:hypothetical protein